MGFVWAVRRSLRLLTLLTLMASTLCTGQSLAAHEIAPPRATLAEGIALTDEAPPALVTAEIFDGESAVSLASAISATATTFGPALAYPARLFDAHAATAPPFDRFSPRAERAPPAA